MKTLLKVLSILMVIVAAVSAVLGVLAIAGGSVLGMPELQAELTEDESIVAAGASLLAVVIGAIIIISAIFILITGIFGWMGANGKQGKLNAALVMGWISLGLGVVSLVMAIVEKTGNMASQVVSLAVPALFVVAATYAKKSNSLQG